MYPNTASGSRTAQQIENSSSRLFYSRIHRQSPALEESRTESSDWKTEDAY